MTKGIARAIANNDVIHISWSFDEPLSGCAGFMLERQPADGSKPWAPLSSLVEFEDRTDESVALKPTTVRPVEGFRWRDFLDRDSRDVTVHYRITAMIGGGSFSAMPGIAPLVTNDVDATEKVTGEDGPIDVYFNRGILSTQALARLLDKFGGPSVQSLQKALCDPKKVARTRLSGELPKALLSQLDLLAKEGGSCHAALYELTDKELIARLFKARTKLHVVL